MSKQILVVEDDNILNQLIVDQVNHWGYTGHGTTTWGDAQSFMEEHEPDLIILDNKLPDALGSQLVSELSPFYPTVMLTAFGSVQDAVKAIRCGASDYLIKPVDPEELELVIKRVMETEVLRANFTFYRDKSRGRGKKLLIGNSHALLEVDQMIGIVAPSDMTVLINGESGVGKELVAQELHERSDRYDKNFVALDCCTIQENLFESELFGYEKGAFTGAERRKPGLIETAENGTLFLDEIGDIAPQMQTKLLRLLETGTYRRVGGTQDVKSNVRIVAATNRDLDEMVKEGTFRQDLLYRLNAFIILMPPLRDRREDIPALAKHFIANHDFSRRIVKRLSPTTLRRLTAYDWPGNVRELRNVIERAIILSQEQAEISPEHLAFCANELRQIEASSCALSFDEDITLETLEKRYLTHLLKKHNQHRGKVAQLMGVSERNIYRLIKKYEL